MPVDVNAVARVLGIEAKFVPQTGGAGRSLPQRICVIAQGQTGLSYSTNKFQATSSGQVGNIGGFGTPAHLILDQLMPANGDGVGTIPVDVCLLADDGSGAAAVGDITPSGTQTVAASYQVRVSGILSGTFVIPAGAVTGAALTSLLKSIGDAVSSVLKMPVTVTYTYGTVTASALTGTGNGTITALSVTGAPVPGAYTLVVNTVVANGGVWTLTDPNGVVVSTTVTMTPGAGGTTVITAGGLQFTLTDGSTDFGLGAKFTITVPVTKVSLTSKWKGTSANNLKIEIIGDTTLGTTFAITQPVGGLVNPNVSAALAQLGNVWNTMVINAMEIADTATLDLIQAVGETRWGALVHKPFIAFTGTFHKTEALATAVSAVRKTDRINAQVVAPGSINLPFVICAAEVAKIAVVANNNPATDYGAQPVPSIIPGADVDQWDYPTRDAAVKAGSSTVEVVDGVIQIGDVVTFYHPTGEDPPGYRYVNDIVKLQNCIYQFALRFGQADWAAAPLIADEEPTRNENAKKPKMAKTDAAAILDDLGLDAILTDVATSKKNITVVFSPRRVDLTIPLTLSGNSAVKSVVLPFSFPVAIAA